VADFVTDRLEDAEKLLIAFNGEVWSGGFDLPFLRSRYAAHEMPWPFDMAYADVLPVISDRFNTTVDGEEQRDLAAVYALLGDGSYSDIDPFDDSAAAVTAFEEGASRSSFGITWRMYCGRRRSARLQSATARKQSST